MAFKELNLYKFHPLIAVVGLVLVALLVIMVVLIGAAGRVPGKGNAGFDADVCWNRVMDYGRGNDRYYWPDGCKGDKPSGFVACTQALVGLTPSEVQQYEAWKKAGGITPPECKRF